MLPSTVVAAVGLWALATNTTGGWVWPRDSVTISEAVAVGDYAEVVRQIESGIDPNRVAEVRPDLLGSAVTHVTPLQAAVWARSPRMVSLLLEHGVIVGDTGLIILKCMNDAHANREVRDLLDALPTVSSLGCDAVKLPE